MQKQLTTNYHRSKTTLLWHTLPPCDSEKEILFKAIASSHSTHSVPIFIWLNILFYIIIVPYKFTYISNFWDEIMSLKQWGKFKCWRQMWWSDLSAACTYWGKIMGSTYMQTRPIWEYLQYVCFIHKPLWDRLGLEDHNMEETDDFRQISVMMSYIFRQAWPEKN